MTHARYAAIILAAGLSTRIEQFKPLLRLGEETITDRVISTFAQNGAHVFLVVGWNKETLLPGIKDQPITVVENPDYQKGMFTSVLAGVRRLQPHHEAFFLMPVDIPLVRPATVHRLLDEAAAHPTKIIYPTFVGKRGHPLLIPSSLIPAILEWKQDGGLKAFLDSHIEIAREVQVPDCNILFDIDTDDDFKEALERFRRYDAPTDAECDVMMDVIHPMSPAVRRHCMKVADVAMTIGRRLEQCGRGIDLDMVRTAALLHDLGKGKPAHAEAAGQMLHTMGFGKIGDIVAVHTDFTDVDGQVPLEAKVVYLADKFVEKDKLVSIDERFRTWGRRFAVTPEAKIAILQRKARALKVKHELENILGGSLDEIIFV